MILRMSTLFVRTLREDPADAEVPSHRLLVRAGYIRRAAPGHLHLAAARPAGAAQGRADRPRGDGRDRRPGGALPGAAAPRALRGDRPLDRVRRRHLPAQGPQGRRLPARSHPRGDVHPAGEGPVLLLQGPAALALPDPDQVPRRGPAARRPAARPRVRDEGLLLLRRRRRRAGRVLPGPPRRLHPDLRPARLRLRHRQGDVRRDGRLDVRGVPGQGARSARTPTSAARRATTRPTSRRSRCRRPSRRRTTALPAAHAEAHPRHPHDRHPGGPPQRALPARRPALDGRRHPQERAGRCSSTPTAPASPWSSACPGDREVDQKRLEGQLEPTEVRAVGRGRVRRVTPPW